MEIHNKEFKSKFRGYDRDEVDRFLDVIVEDFEKLYKENIDLKDKMRASEGKVETYKTLEDTLRETLVTAQKTAEEVVMSAQQKADQKLKEAELTSSKIVNEGYEKLAEVKREYETVKSKVEVLKIKFRKLLEAEIEILDRADIV